MVNKPDIVILKEANNLGREDKYVIPSGDTGADENNPEQTEWC